MRKRGHREAVQRNEKNRLRHPKFGTVLNKSKDQLHRIIIFPNYEDYRDLYAKFLGEKTSFLGKRLRPPPPLIPITHTPRTPETTLREIGDFINFYREGILHHLNYGIFRHSSVKVILSLNIALIERTAEGETLHQSFGLRSACSEIYASTNLVDWLTSQISALQTRFEEAEFAGSGWSFDKILDLGIQINRFVPLSASSYISLPKSIAGRLAVINIKNSDNKCFFYAVACKFLPKHTLHKERVGHYTVDVMKNLNFKGMNLSGPTKLQEIDIFEKNNECSVNIYGLTDNKTNPSVYPIRIASTLYVSRLLFAKINTSIFST